MELVFVGKRGEVTATGRGGGCEWVRGVQTGVWGRNEKVRGYI
jgi:hypothetical protein